MRAGVLRRLVTASVIAVGVVVLIMVFGKLASAETTASLTIKVEAPGPSHGFEFSGGYDGANFTETLYHGDQYTLGGIVVDAVNGTQVGIHQAIESEPWLWRLTGIECSSYIDSPFGPVPFGDVSYGYTLENGYLWVNDPEPGRNIVCTFTNDYVAGSFTFKTEVDAGNSNQVYTWNPDQEFTYDVYLSNDLTFIPMKDGDYRTDTALPVPEQYTVYQWLIPGWETEVDCTGSAYWWSEVEGQKIYVRADFDEDETLFCTFTNTYVVSSLTIEVDAPEKPGQEFTFSGSSDAPTGDPTTSTGVFDPVLNHGESHTQYFVVGELIHVAVTENVPPGWDVTDIDCVEFVDTLFGDLEIPYDPPVVYLEWGQVELYPEAGVNLKCTFTNDYLAGQINITKEVIGDNPGGSFDFSMGSTSLGSLPDGGMVRLEDLAAPNQYQITELDEPGWELVDISCLGGEWQPLYSGADSTLNGVSIDLENGDIVSCTFSNTYVNEPPVADAGGPYVLNEGSILFFDGGGSSDPDGDPLTYEWDLDNDGEFDDATGVAPSLFYPDGPALLTVGLKVTDLLGESDTDTSMVTVSNVAPLVATPLVNPAPSDEGAAVTASATFTDPAGVLDMPYVCTVDYGDGSGPLAGTVSGNICTGPSHVYADNGDYTVELAVTDDDGGSGLASVVHEVVNVPPVVSVSSDAQTVQYSDLIDDITINGTDVAADDLTVTVTAVPGLSLDLEDCSVASGVKTCEWTLSGPVQLPAGNYTLSVAVEDDDGGIDTTEVTLTVLHEDALVAFGTDNPIVVPVTEAGSDESEPFSLLAYVQEVAESGDHVAPGDINLAQVAVTLEPVGPGSPVTVACYPTAPVVPYDYSAVLEVSCDVSRIPVNAYVTTVSIGGDYYRGNTDEDVVVVYDPSLGFTTGGGWFAWPGTGERTTFGYTMKYNKKATNVQGSMVVIRRTADGERYRLKSNAIFGLALGETGEMGWASFLGKATYQEPGMAEAEGNHTFMVYVEDRGEPGAGSDRFWIEVLDKDDRPVALSIDRPAEVTAAELGGGNIVVPHKPRKGAR